MHVIGIVICTMIRFLLMYSKQFLSQYNHSKREYGFINFYLCLASQPRNCQFLLYSTDFAPHVECTLIKIYLIKCTLVYTSAHMLKLYLQSLYNTILASKEFFFPIQNQKQNDSKLKLMQSSIHELVGLTLVTVFINTPIIFFN